MEIAFCMRCREQKEFVSEPVYKEFDTSRGKKAMISGTCVLGHKMSKICKVRV